MESYKNVCTSRRNSRAEFSQVQRRGAYTAVADCKNRSEINYNEDRTVTTQSATFRGASIIVEEQQKWRIVYCLNCHQLGQR